ncbi:hypothetical protein C8R48DRAFT_163165 [Suillus tomentosus]|nr:hypothetical protein C8R48DRAFT_163165 [Suillus tomentosus]
MGLSKQVVSHFLLYYLVDLYAPRLVIYIIDLSLACTFLVFVSFFNLCPRQVLDSSLSCTFIMILLSPLLVCLSLTFVMYYETFYSLLRIEVFDLLSPLLV